MFNKFIISLVKYSISKFYDLKSLQCKYSNKSKKIKLFYKKIHLFSSRVFSHNFIKFVNKLFFRAIRINLRCSNILVIPYILIYVGFVTLYFALISSSPKRYLAKSLTTSTFTEFPNCLYAIRSSGFILNESGKFCIRAHSLGTT